MSLHAANNKFRLQIFDLNSSFNWGITSNFLGSANAVTYEPNKIYVYFGGYICSNANCDDINAFYMRGRFDSFVID
jgi:hypothetical protein